MSEINYDVEAYGDIWTNISESSAKKTKNFVDRVYKEADRICKEKADMFRHIEPFSTNTDDGYIEIKFSIYPDEFWDEDTYIDGAYFDSVFGNYLPDEKVIRTLVWDFDSARDELHKLSDMLDKVFPANGKNLNEDCFDFEADDLPDPPVEDYDEELY